MPDISVAGPTEEQWQKALEALESGPAAANEDVAAVSKAIRTALDLTVK